MEGRGATGGLARDGWSPAVSRRGHWACPLPPANGASVRLRDGQAGQCRVNEPQGPGGIHPGILKDLPASKDSLSDKPATVTGLPVCLPFKTWLRRT